MTYEQYCQSGYRYADYIQLSQWQRLRGLVISWRKSKAIDKGIAIATLWDDDDLENDWVRVSDWWHPRRWHRWHFGFDQCQNYHRFYFGPIVVLFAT